MDIYGTGGGLLAFFDILNTQKTEMIIFSVFSFNSSDIILKIKLGNGLLLEISK